MRKVVSVISLIFVALFSITSLEASMLNQEPSFNNIVIFIKFADEEDYTAPYELDYYEDLFNGEDQISLRDYYLEATYDELTINSYLATENSEIIWYQDTKVRSYYEEYNESSNPNGFVSGEEDEREHQLLKRAIDYVDARNLIPDDLELDTNDDGTIDSITFMVSGNDDGWLNIFWPHMWSLYSFQYTDDTFTADAPTINGVNALYYSFELLGLSKTYSEQVDVGVLAHETFHMLSAPDLYHYYEYPEITPVGDWGIMDNTSVIPSHMLGYMKYKYGNWIDEVETITESGTYTLYPLQDSPNNIYKIPTNYPNEYIYLEYRDDEGFYESNLPDTGLLVYRVNTSLNGNEDGSYDENGIPTDEVWVFRPGMEDDELPIIIEDKSYIVDGSINEAALSNNNYYNSVGEEQEIILFNGAGELINIAISNTQEHDGYITFDVTLPPSITLDAKVNFEMDNVILLDNINMEYNVTINNIPSDVDVYYTLDGSTPTNESQLLVSNTVSINATEHIVKVAFYKNDEFVLAVEKGFTFNSTIESSHSSYGDEISTFWYLDFGDTTHFDITADSRSFIETDYDFIYIEDSNTTTTYTGDELSSIAESYVSDYLLINLTSDEYVSDFYGISLELEVQTAFSFTIVGESNITIPVYSTYTDLGAFISGEESSLYTYETTENTVDTATPGIYHITYNLLDADENFVTTLIRTVKVLDNQAPEVTLNGEEIIYLDLNSVYDELGVTATDNYDTELDVTISEIISTATVGTTIITYTVTDDTGNSTILTRTIIVFNDTEAPIVNLNPSVDTIYVNEQWRDNGIITEDHTETLITITGSVDNTIPGTYTITYEVVDKYGNTTIAKRFVTVLEIPITLEVTCDPFDSTIHKDTPLNIGDCYVGDELMTVDSSKVTYSIIGAHEINYSLEQNGHTYHKVQYVYVLVQNTTNVAYIERKEYL